MTTDKNIFSRRFLPTLVPFICLLIFCWHHLPYDQNKTIINGDGKGYYAYLPAVFIYQDLSFSFAGEMEKKHYPPANHHHKNFLNDTNDGTVNKYFSGLALLWLPFFLLAHLFTLAVGGEADGYGMFYQLSIGLASATYLFLAIRWLRKFLISLQFSQRPSLLAIVLFVIGSNLFYYTVYDPSLSHAYSFSLVCGLLWYARQYWVFNKRSYLVKSVLMAGLIVAVRPQNVLLVFPVLLFATVPSGFIKTDFSSRVKHLPLLLLGLIPLVPQLLLWYLQTGHFITDSYSGESFHLLNPHVKEILFSFEKGWFLYTPMVLLGLAGLLLLKRLNVRIILFLLFLAGVIYLFSTWWIWTYGHSFGQRVFIEYYPFLILGLAALLMHKSSAVKSITLAIALLFTGLNQLQAFQHYSGILPAYGVDQRTYFSSFFRTSPHAVYRFADHYVAGTLTKTFDGNGFSYADTPASFRVSKLYPFGPSCDIRLNKFPGSLLVSARVKAFCEGDCTGARMVIDFRTENESISYHSFELNPYLDEVPEMMQFGVPAPQHADMVRVYLWSPESADAVVAELMSVSLHMVKRKPEVFNPS